MIPALRQATSKVALEPLPGRGVADVVAVREVPDDDLVALGLEPLDERGADPRRAAGDERPHAGSPANISRSAVLRNLPTPVFGIASTNSNRSGSHHFAKLGCEEVVQLLGGRGLALAQHDDGERPLLPLLVRDPDHRRLGDGRVAHQRVLERDRRDPLAAGLDHVLRPVLDLDVAARVERDDVAGPEPAVVGPAVGLLGRVVVARRDPRAADLELAHRLAVARDLVPLGIARAELDERQRQALLRDVVERVSSSASSRSGWRSDSLATGEVSVMPQPWITVSPWRCLKPAIIARGAAEPPTSIPFSAERSQRSGSASSIARIPSQIVGTPAVAVTRSCAKSSSRLSRVEVRPRDRPASRRASSRCTDSPTRSRGTSARRAGSRRAARGGSRAAR